MNNSTRRASILVSLTLLLCAMAGTTFAAVLSVPGAFPTIQAAIAASSPGDTIVIGSGTYEENLLILPVKTGLTLIGNCGNPRLVVVDASPGGVEGDGILVRAFDTDIRCLTIRHADVGVRSTADKTRLYKVHILRSENEAVRVGLPANPRNDFDMSFCQVRGSEDAVRAWGDDGSFKYNDIANIDGDALEFDGDDWDIQQNQVRLVDSGRGFFGAGDRNVVKRNTLRHIDGAGVALLGDENEASDNTIVNTGRAGIRVRGDDADLLRNKLTDTGGTGLGTIRVAGDNALVDRNEVRGTGSGGRRRGGGDTDCYDINGDNAVVTYNYAEGCDSDAFEVDGDSPDVRYNEVLHTGEDCFDVRCSGSCGSARVEYNIARDCGASEGFDLDDAGAGGVSVQWNQVHGAAEECYDLDLDSAEIKWNRAFDCGTNSEECYDVSGDDNLFQGNAADRCMEDALDLNGDRNDIRNNQLRNALEDGIDGSGADNEYRYNVTQGHHAEGIDHSGTDTVMIGNTSTNNRDNCTNNGTFAAGSPSGNNCGGGTVFVDPPEID